MSEWKYSPYDRKLYARRGDYIREVDPTPKGPITVVHPPWHLLKKSKRDERED